MAYRKNSCHSNQDAMGNQIMAMGVSVSPNVKNSRKRGTSHSLGLFGACNPPILGGEKRKKRGKSHNDQSSAQNISQRTIRRQIRNNWKASCTSPRASDKKSVRPPTRCKDAQFGETACPTTRRSSFPDNYCCQPGSCRNPIKGRRVAGLPCSKYSFKLLDRDTPLGSG